MGNEYLDMLRRRGSKDVEMKPTERQQAWTKQKGRCAKCGKEINKLYAKYQKNPLTQEMEVICMDCSIKIPRR